MTRNGLAVSNQVRTFTIKDMPKREAERQRTVALQGRCVAADRRSAVWLIAAVLATGGISFAQAPATNASQQPAAQNANAISAAQPNLYNATGTNGAAAGQDSFKGSVVSGKNTGTVIDLSLDEAIQRGLRQNLGVILQGSSIQ